MSAIDSDRMDEEKSASGNSGPSESVSINADRNDLRIDNGLKIKSDKKIKIVKTKVMQ